MSRMQELYETVAADSVLQSKFAEILKDAEMAEESVTNGKLIEFAKESGYDVTLDEMKDFFQAMAETENGVLGEAELDMVAGGKSELGHQTAAYSITTMGLGCAAVSALAAIATNDCDRYFK